jgi:wobble nucleotide-excising tRNase
MIEKIISIKNVGRFEDYACSGDVTFRRLNLLYAENGQGKTTLVAVLRSLCTGVGDYIQERCTLGSTGAPTVSILLDGKPVCFADGAWNGTLPETEVFDPRFVAENVHAGPRVEHEHKKNLYKFVVGEQGVLLAHKLEELDDKIREMNSAIRTSEGEVQKHIKGNISVDNFAKLEPLDGIDALISAAEKEIATVKKSDAIKSKDALSEIQPGDLQVKEMTDLLAVSLENVSAESEELVRKHIAEHMGEAGESWINDGMTYLADERCPFCTQDVKHVPLVAAYRAHFSEQYVALKARISDALATVDGTLFQDTLLSLQGSIASNGSLSEFWKDYVTGDFPAISFDEIRLVCDKLLQLMRNHLRRKANSPVESVHPSTALLKKMAEYEALRDKIDGYNKSVREVNKRIAATKKEISSADLATAEGKLTLLANTKARHSQPASKLCDDHLKLRTAKENLEKDKADARKDLQGYTQSVLALYEKQINDYLDKFGAGFRIVQVVEQFPGGKPSLSYCISINDVAVSLEPPKAPALVPSFKNTLSSGDLTSLAFSFFMARIDQTPGLKDRIIVFDDPISSLDGHRKTATRQQVLRIANTAKQVIVLSHDPYFLRLVWDSADKSMRRALSIVRSGKGSVLRAWDVEKETEGEYFQNYFALVQYLEGGPEGDLRIVARCIRPLLEGNLRMRFPGQFAKGDWLLDMINKIRVSKEGDALFSLISLADDLWEINDYSKRYHHGSNPDADKCPISDGELKTYVERTLKALYGVLTPVVAK